MSVPSTGDPIVAYRPHDDFAVVAIPVTAHGISVRTEKNGAGTAQVSILLSDPAADLIHTRDIIAIRRDGTTIASMLVEKIHEHTLDPAGPSRQTVTYQGRLAGAVLEWMLIAPALGDQAKPIEDDTVFDWRSRRYNPATYSDTWSDATEIMTVAAAEAGGWPHQPMAEDFDLNVGAEMIGAAGDTSSLGDMGWRLFYRDIEITTAGRYGSEHLMDDFGSFWIDTTLYLDVNSNDGFVRASFKSFDLSAGIHRFCWAVYNPEDPEVPGAGWGPTALAYNIFKADLQDRPLAGGDRWVSDSNTKVMYVGEGDWPGMTVGDDLTQVIEEARDGTVEAFRNVAPWIIKNFNEGVDSAGNDWDRELGITTKTGTTNVLQFFDELVASGRISQYRVRPDAVTLDVFAPAYSARPTPTGYPLGIELEPAPVLDARSGQLVQLDRTIT